MLICRKPGLGISVLISIIRAAGGMEEAAGAVVEEEVAAGEGGGQRWWPLVVDSMGWTRPPPDPKPAAKHPAAKPKQLWD